jgi:5'-3' exonuclease
MVVLFDADSLIWSSCYRKRETPDDEMWNGIEEAKGKFDEVLMHIVNTIEETYEVDKVIVFAGARGNFRKQITKKYKANRINRELPPCLNELQSYVKEQYNAIAGYGVETDDVVATYWTRLTNELGTRDVMIVSIDKDYKQLPCLIYNYHYKHKCYIDLNELEARNFFWTQMIAGDTADNVNYCKGYGEVYCKKAFIDCLSDYSYMRVVFALYKKLYRSKARERFIECYLQIKLKTE